VIETIDTTFARRLRDVERAGKLRNRLYSAAFGVGECAHFSRHTLSDPELAARFERKRDFYLTLFEKVCRVEARARGEAER
jgi:hypothetical protein